MNAGLCLDGLLSEQRRKTGWLRAAAAGDPGPWRQQALLGRHRWDADALRDLVRAYVVAHLADDAAGLVIDETGFLKQGKASCGVARQYTGPAGKITNCRIGVLAVVAAQEMGAGRVIVIGAPEQPRLALCRQFGAEATVDITEHAPGAPRIAAVRDIVGGFGADIVMDCSGHPSAGPEGIEMLRDGGTYIEMGQFTDAGAIETSWHRFCAKDITLLGSWAFTADDIWTGIQMLHRARDRYPFHTLQMRFPLSEQGIAEAVAAARAMRCMKATIVPAPDLADR